MSNSGCPQEQTVARMARTGLWDEATTRHARQCPACREVSAAVVRMGSIAGQADAPDSLPEAGLLWWKHELMERYRHREQAARPIRIMEGITATLTIVALTVGISLASFSLSSALTDNVDSLTTEWLPSLLSMILTGSLTQGALTALATAAAIAAGIVYPLWRER